MILITGASGFIGKALTKQAKSLGYNVRGAVRNQSAAGDKSETYLIPFLDGNTDWSGALRSCNVVVHLAAMAHKEAGSSSEELATFIAVNSEATVNLARQAHEAGVERFIFLSSTGVMGPQVTSGFTYGPNSNLEPHDSYTRSKASAEQELLQLSKEVGLGVTIVRAPVVYGPDAPGTIGSLTKAIRHGLPLPLGGLRNRRHLISLENLVDLVISCISAPMPITDILIACDDEALSTSDLCSLCGNFAGKRPRLIPVPPSLLMFIAGLLGNKKRVATLLGDLELDSSKTKLLLKWSPPYSPSEHIRRT